jgi:hypothetical protein
MSKHITWQIDIEADTAREAAKKALVAAWPEPGEFMP